MSTLRHVALYINIILLWPPWVCIIFCSTKRCPKMNKIWTSEIWSFPLTRKAQTLHNFSDDFKTIAQLKREYLRNLTLTNGKQTGSFEGSSMSSKFGKFCPTNGWYYMEHLICCHIIQWYVFTRRLLNASTKLCRIFGSGPDLKTLIHFFRRGHSPLPKTGAQTAYIRMILRGYCELSSKRGHQIDTSPRC